MASRDLEERVKNIDQRTMRIEQILPTLATKEDLKSFATKENLKSFATKEDLKAYATRDEMKAEIQAEGALTRAHFNVVAEAVQESVKVIAEGHETLSTKIDTLASDVKRVLGNHEGRITRLEAEQIKGR